MRTWFETYLRATLARVIDDERGQDVLVWIIILAIIWLLVMGRRVVVQ